MAKKVDDFRNLNQANKKKSSATYGDVAKKRNMKEKKTKSTTTKLAVFFSVLIVLGIFVGMLFSPEFNLSQVIVKDGVNVKSAEVLDCINVNYGENIFKQNYKMLKGDVSTLPYINDVRIKLGLPNKIRIEYEERVPYALVKYLESFFVVDKYGYLLEIKKENDMNTLPIIYGVEIEEYELGKTLQGTSKKKYENIVFLLETAMQKEFPYSIYEINYESVSGVKIWVNDVDIDIIYGEVDKNQIQDKLDYLKTVLDNLKNKKGKLDISSNNYRERIIFTERID